MNLVARIGQAFVDEFKRPGTQVLLIAACLFLVGIVLDLSHHWTDATRPVGIRLLWLFSPVSIVLPLYPMTTWKGFGKRILAFLGVYAGFVLMFYVLFGGWFQMPTSMSSTILLGLTMAEMGLLTWIAATKKFGESPVQSYPDERSQACL